uniref:Putative secreted peptide n=1 Tax=Anopheles braziliensis TaxID=58242 RepID=A0A2M3ZQI8_9DIPT
MMVPVPLLLQWLLILLLLPLLLLLARLLTPSMATACGLSNATGTDGIAAGATIPAVAAAGVLLTMLPVLLLLLRPGFWYGSFVRSWYPLSSLLLFPLLSISSPLPVPCCWPPPPPPRVVGELWPEPGEILPAIASSEFSIFIANRSAAAAGGTVEVVG